MHHNLDRKVICAINNAKAFAKECKNSYIGTEHLLVGILMIKNCKLEKELSKYQIDESLMKNEIKSLFGFENNEQQDVLYTKTLVEIFEQSEQIANANNKETSIDDITLLLLNAENNVANELLRRHDVDIKMLINKVSENDCIIFDSYKELKNLNKFKKENNFAISGRDSEINEIIQVLSKMEKSNCILVGEAGVGKSAIVEHLALLINQKKVPSCLLDNIILELNLNSLVAGTKYRGEFEEKLQTIIDLIKDNKKVILFIDEIHLMVNAGKAEGSLDVASVLKPYLARSNLRCIGATTPFEYQKFIEKDKALKRRFQKIVIDEPSGELLFSMLYAKSKQLQLHHKVKISNNVINQCIDLATIQILETNFPDKAIDLLDIACTNCLKDKLSSVSIKHIEQALRLITHLPNNNDNNEFINEVKKNKLINKDEITKLYKRLISINEFSVIDVWGIDGKNESKMLFCKLICEKYFGKSDQSIEINCSNFNQLGTYQYLNIIKNIVSLKKYGLIYFNNYSSITNECKAILEKGFRDGVIVTLEDEKINISNFLIVTDKKSVSKCVGFLSFNNVKNNDFVLSLNNINQIKTLDLEKVK